MEVNLKLRLPNSLVATKALFRAFVVKVPKSRKRARECLHQNIDEAGDKQVDFDKLYSLVVDSLAPKKKQASLDTYFSKLNL